VCPLSVIFGVQFKPLGEKHEIHSLCFYVCDCVSWENVSASTLLVATSHVQRPPSPPSFVRVPYQPMCRLALLAGAAAATAGSRIITLHARTCCGYTQRQKW